MVSIKEIGTSITSGKPFIDIKKTSLLSFNVIDPLVITSPLFKVTRRFLSIKSTSEYFFRYDKYWLSSVSDER